MAGCTVAVYIITKATHVLCTCFFRQLIYNYPEQLFADAGVMAIEHADFEGVERLALVTGRMEHDGHSTCACSSCSFILALGLLLIWLHCRFVLIDVLVCHDIDYTNLFLSTFAAWLT